MLPEHVVQPEARRSTNGVLSTTLETALATNSFVDVATGLDKTVETPTNEGSLIGPTLQGAEFNIIALDGFNLPEMRTMPIGLPLVLGAGNRADALIKAPAAGTYLLQAVDPVEAMYSVSPQGVAPGVRRVRIGGDFPDPVYPVTLATIVVEGDELDMPLPAEPFPQVVNPISREDLLAAVPDATRRVAFEHCGRQGNMTNPDHRLPSCDYYFDLYDADYWGGLPFETLLMMRDADDEGEPVDPVNFPSGPRSNYRKEGLFNVDESLFDDMIGGNIEEWTVINRSPSDHSFHIHQNPFLLTHINGQPLPEPEWRDTILVPGATGGNGNINAAMFGTVTLRTYLHPDYIGKILTHCHVLTHEDFGMMQMIEIKP